MPKKKLNQEFLKTEVKTGKLLYAFNNRKKVQNNLIRLRMEPWMEI